MVPEIENEKKRSRRNRKGSGCVYRPKFRTKDGKVRFGGWRIKYTWNHVPYDESVDVQTKAAAEEILKQRFTEIRSGTFVKGSEAESLRYEDMRDLLLKEYEREERKSLLTAKDGKKFVHHLKHVNEFFRGRMALSIDAQLLDAYVIQRQRAGAQNGTINRGLSLLRHMFRIAVRRKLLRTDHMPEFTMLKEADPREGFLEPEDFPRLRQELPEYLRAPFTLAYLTGMRLNEILSLRWTNVDFLGGEIRLEDSKNGEKRTIPLLGETSELLKIERTRFPGCQWVFSHDGRGHITKLNAAWRSACVCAGLGHFFCRACGTQLDAQRRCSSCSIRCKNPRYQGLLFHDLRRSGVRNLTRAGVSQHIAMKISGHKTDSVFRRYDIVSSKDLQDAARRVNAYVADRISQRLVKVEENTDQTENPPKALIQ